MNRLNYLMSKSWYNARIFRVHHVNDIRSQRAHEHCMREFRMYHALCRCIRRGYKPLSNGEMSDDDL